MTPIWHDGPLATLAPTAHPVVWSVPDASGDARGASARALVAQLASVGCETVRLTRSLAGAPQVASPSGWYIGLSRRGGTCLVAAARQPIAVDREVMEDAPPLWDMLTPDEAAALSALAAHEQSRAWLRRWTIKEAHAKLIGEPRRIAPEAIASQLIDGVEATATFEGTSHCWTRGTGDGLETVALWREEIQWAT